MVTLTLSVVISLVTAVVYGYVGYRMSQRQVVGDARLAHQMFVLWWAALSASSLLSALMVTLYKLDALPLWLYQSITQLSLLLIIVALLGLLFYLVYLYTGNRSSLGWMVVVYVLFYAALVGLIQWLGAPEALTDDGWTIVQDPQPDLPDAVSWAFLIFLLGPQLGASFAYLRLYKHARTPTQRYRIAVVSGSILVWFGSSLLASAAQLEESLWWQMFSRLLSVLASLAILAAYFPPAFLAKRYGLERLTDVGHSTGRDT